MQKLKSPFWSKLFTILKVLAVVLTAAIVIFAAYVVFSHPFAIVEEQDEKFDHPLFTEEQEETLRSIGVEPASLPLSIAPHQEECAIEALGKEKVEQIKKGNLPSLSDYFKIKHCLE